MSSQVETAADRLQALGAFDKSAVDAAELSGQEIARVLVRLGLGAPELAVKLTNGACAANYPPGPSNIWALVAIDNAAIDVGTITQFTLRGPDGITRQGHVPVQIPDNDPNGALVLLNP